ncbi:unnamed protein product, partial [Urochloa humidicola]
HIHTKQSPSAPIPSLQPPPLDLHTAGPRLRLTIMPPAPVAVASTPPIPPLAPHPRGQPIAGRERPDGIAPEVVQRLRVLQR